MRPSHVDSYGFWSATANATQRGFRWLFRGRPGSRVRGATLALGCLVALSTLVASAVTPRPTSARATPRRPAYLRPLGSLIKGGMVPLPTLRGDHGSVGIPRRTPKPPARANARTAARQAPEIARYQGTSGTLRPADIATLALEHGCGAQAAPTASAIAMAESGGSPGAQGDIGLMNAVWDWSAGLWQIRGLRAERGTGALRDSIANQQVDHNANAMYTISHGCSDWTPWSTYGNGDYRQFLALAAQAVRYVLAYYRAHGGRYPPVLAPSPNAAIPSQGIGSEQSPAGHTKQPSRQRHHRQHRQHRHQTRRARAAHNRPAIVPKHPPVIRTKTKPHTSGVPLPLPTKPLPIPTPTPTRLPTSPVPLPTVTKLPTPSLP